ncbi:MAG: hypothetical protein MI974_26220 [Chitinophagales bacterium]|nr:hypothetical protein [Chitinophagales bacterium]
MYLVLLDAVYEKHLVICSIFNYITATCQEYQLGSAVLLRAESVDFELL